MFLFGSSKVLLKGSLYGITDCHSHILPGVDDGVQSMEDSLSILEMYEKLGVRKVWFTPHIMEDLPNKTEKLKEIFDELESAYNKDFNSRNVNNNYSKVEISLSAEYMLDGLFQERLKQKDLLTHGEMKNHLLVETSYFNPPYNLKGTIENILSAGYYPILAHPERYVYMGDNDYKELKQLKVLFQMNLSSLAGMYGKDAMKKAEKMLKLSYYNFIGSDLHRKSQLEALVNCKVTPFINKIVF